MHGKMYYKIHFLQPVKTYGGQQILGDAGIFYSNSPPTIGDGVILIDHGAGESSVYPIANLGAFYTSKEPM